jgi:MFS family permease
MKYVLPVIVVSQFLCTTLWFVGNAVMPEVGATFGLPELFFAHQTSAVQLGFISGTLIFALLAIADRFSPSRVFFVSALIAALCNAALLAEANTAASILFLRFTTGFFLAGIYPVGMKIAADYFDKGLGKSLGFLVGALVLGTAFPHLLRGYLVAFNWQHIITLASCLAVSGGILILMFVPDGPFRKPAGKIDWAATRKIFGNAGFRSAAFGYFGHMWELYAFWSFVPLMLTSYAGLHGGLDWNFSAWSFIVIGVGFLACIGAGFLSTYVGERTTATLALAASGVCCLLSPLVFKADQPWLFLGFLAFWGIVVVADSPMFSTLVARNTHAHQRGTALTLVNCIGFFITIVSIQVLGWLLPEISFQYLFLFLAPGPALGLIALASGRHVATEPPL